MKIPDSIKPFVDEFSKLPSIGPRQALRLAFYLADKGPSAITPITKALLALAELKICPDCFSTHDKTQNLCGICSDPARNRSTIALVEKETDLLSIEASGSYKGIYFVLGDVKKTGSLDDRQKSRLDALKKAISGAPEGKVGEIIMAFSPTTSGDISAEIVAEYLRGYANKISKLGRGIPTGGEVEFADPETLSEALKGRR